MDVRIEHLSLLTDRLAVAVYGLEYVIVLRTILRGNVGFVEFPPRYAISRKEDDLVAELRWNAAAVRRVLGQLRCDGLVYDYALPATPGDADAPADDSIRRKAVRDARHWFLNLETLVGTVQRTLNRLRSSMACEHCGAWGAVYRTLCVHCDTCIDDPRALSREDVAILDGIQHNLYVVSGERPPPRVERSVALEVPVASAVDDGVDEGVDDGESDDEWEPVGEEHEAYLVTVGGTSKDIMLVTEEDKEKMNDAEFLEFYTLMREINAA